jgi:hypothetical protein
MTASRWRRCRGALFAGTTIAAAAAVVAGLAAPALARPSAAVAITAKGPGYPPPKGIYKPFTNCPLKNPIMAESTGVTLCVAGNATSGTIKLGNITTQVTSPVDVQFGAFSPPGGVAGSLPSPPPLSGDSAILATGPDSIPGTLTDALGCATATDATIVGMCQQIAANPGDNTVTALAQEAGPVTQFALFSWQQEVKFQLINPLLGSNCYIGSDYSPVVLHPHITINPGGGLTTQNDPQPTVHPDTAVLSLNNASATDSTFSAPGVTGCGPGGTADIAVDEALNAWSGLPAASGNTLSLSGSFLLADNFAVEDSSLPQPQDNASDMLAAFKASTNGEHSVKSRVTKAQAKAMLGLGG